MVCFVQIRGINEKTLKAFGHQATGDENSFNLKNAYGEVIGQLVHSPGAEQKYHKAVRGAMNLLMGEEILPQMFYGRPLVIVEGAYDMMSIIQEGVPCIAALTSSLSRRKLEKIRRYTNRLVFWFDSDSSGEQGLKDTIKSLDYMPDMIYRIFRENSYKDANDLLQGDPGKFKEVIENLKLLRKEL